MTPTEETLAEVASDATFEELKRLFRVYRLANLNMRYYGARAGRYERFSWRLNIASGAASAIALVVLLTPQFQDHAKLLAGSLAGLAAFLTAMTPLLGWESKAKKFCNMQFAFSQIFGQLEGLIRAIRKAGEVTPEQAGAAEALHDLFFRIESMDEMEPDKKLIDRLNPDVLKAFPDDYVWTNF